ncbi:MAG: dipeptide epimerase [Myxococcaceae bacterium]
MRFESATIESLTAEELSVPLWDPFVIATGRVDATRSVLIKVGLRRGARLEKGLGEASCLPPVTKEDQPDALNAARDAKLTGKSFGDWTELHALLDATLENFPVARSGVEMAILDALARLEDVPLFTLLSGVTSPKVIETDITLPILPPARMAELAVEWWSKGFRSFKVKVGRALSEDLAALEAIEKAVPGAAIRADANCGYSADTALQFLRELGRFHLKLECFEQPCGVEDLQGLARVAAATDIPVIADESVKFVDQLEDVLAQRAADGVNLKVAKSGGLLRAYDVGRAAKDAGMLLMVGGMVETRLGMTAATHLAAALGDVEFPDLDTAWLLKTDPFVGGYQEDGPRYTLGRSPGLGVDHPGR